VLEPRHFGARMREVLTEKLKLEVCFCSTGASRFYSIFLGFDLIDS
jgi:hypothetical protein